MALAQAEVKSFMIPLSSPFYDMADALYALAGSAKPATSRPWSYAEARNILDALDETRLPESAASLYDDAREELEANQPRWSFDNGTVGFTLRASLNPEMYVHTNEKSRLDWDYISSDRYWWLTWEDRQKFVNVDIDFSVKSFFYSFISADFTRAKYADTTDTYTKSDFEKWGYGSNGKPKEDIFFPKSSGAYSNIFNFNGMLDVINFNFPSRAFGAFGGDNWYLTIGRERMNWGDSHIGNLLIDDSVEYQDAVRFAAFSDNDVFRWEMVYSFFDGGGGTNAQGTGQDNNEYIGDEGAVGNKFKMLMAHRVDIRPLRWLSLSLSENVMYGSGQTTGILPRQLNPFGIFHNNIAGKYFNAIAWIDFTVTPFRGFNVYGQFALDQFEMPWEASTNNGNEEAGAWGALAGAEYTHTLGRGYYTTSLEGAYTTPHLYRRYSPDFIVWREAGDFQHGMPFYMGFPYGGDAIVANADFWYTMPGVFKVGFEWQGLIHGAMNMLQPTYKSSSSYQNSQSTQRPLTTPSTEYITPSTNGNGNGNGTATQQAPLYQMMFTLAGEYEVPKFVKWMDITVRASASLVLRADHDADGDGNMCDAQFTAGASFKF